MCKTLIIIGVLLITAPLTFGGCSPTATPTEESPMERSVTGETTVTPNPPTAEEAIAMVRASPEMSKAVAPFKQELDWRAEWVEDRWWVVGLFESSWGVKFVSDATIWNGKVYAYIDYSMRPEREWVEVKAKDWGLQHLYTRLTPNEALTRVKESSDVRYAIREVTVIDEVAELVEDSALSQGWRFAFYVMRKDGSNAILAVEGYGGKGAEEGNYSGGYGFGNATETYWEIPLHLIDWIRSVAKNRDWEKAANLL